MYANICNLMKDNLFESENYWYRMAHMVENVSKLEKYIVSRGHACKKDFKN